jgi:hypothetical protein
MLILFQSEYLLTFFPERGVFWPSDSEWPLYSFKKNPFVSYTNLPFILIQLIKGQ